MADPKYGPNEAERWYMCPRCADAVSVFIRKITSIDSIYGENQLEEIHCRKCDYYGHKDGSLIETQDRVCTQPSGK